jgi:hypothetical protein
MHEAMMTTPGKQVIQSVLVGAAILAFLLCVLWFYHPLVSKISAARLFLIWLTALLGPLSLFIALFLIPVAAFDGLGLFMLFQCFAFSLLLMFGISAPLRTPLNPKRARFCSIVSISLWYFFGLGSLLAGVT